MAVQKASFPTNTGHVRYSSDCDRDSDRPDDRRVTCSTKLRCSKIPDDIPASRRTATRFTWGAIFSSSHFALFVFV
jgi:hypothetical protein